MKGIQLSQGKVALVDDEDYDRVNQFKWCAQKSRNTFYAMRTKYVCKMHIYIKMHGFILNKEDSSQIDHWDRNGLNNQKVNLRPCTGQQNSFNRGKRTGCTSKFKGVHFNKERKKYMLQISVNRRQTYLGLFNSEIEAAKAYDVKALELFGEFAYLNFPL